MHQGMFMYSAAIVFEHIHVVVNTGCMGSWITREYNYLLSCMQLCRYLQGTKDQHFVISSSMWYQNVHTSGDTLEHYYTLIKLSWILSSVTFVMTQRNAAGVYCLGGQKKTVVFRGIGCFQLLMIFHSHNFLKLYAKVNNQLLCYRDMQLSDETCQNCPYGHDTQFSSIFNNP